MRFTESIMCPNTHDMQRTNRKRYSILKWCSVKQLTTHCNRPLPNCVRMLPKTNMCIILRILLVQHLKINFNHYSSSFLANFKFWQIFHWIYCTCAMKFVGFLPVEINQLKLPWKWLLFISKDIQNPNANEWIKNNNNFYAHFSYIKYIQNSKEKKSYHYKI